MAEFEKVFIMRQTKDMAKALAKFREKDAVDDVLQMDEKQTDQTDDYQATLDGKIAEELARFKQESSLRRTEVAEED